MNGAAPDTKVGDVWAMAGEAFVRGVCAAGGASTVMSVGKITDGIRPQMKRKTRINKHSRN